jgi:hypothetical protein
MKRTSVLLTALVLLALFLSGCSPHGTGGTKDARLITKPDVKVDLSAAKNPVTPPDIQELRWDFFNEKDKAEVTCRYRLKVVFKEEGQFNARLNFMDLNKFTVTSETIKLIGRKGEETTYENKLYIDPRISNRITKAEIMLTPIH